MTHDNYRELLTPLLTEGGGQGFCVNLSVDTSSRDIMELCRELGALYIDTVAEPWARLLLRQEHGPGGAHQLRAARDACSTRAAQARRPDGGLLLRRQSRHGVVVRQAGAAQRRGAISASTRRADDRARTGRALMSRVGVKGIHIAERDTQRATHPRSRWASSSTPGRSRASCRKACSRPSSAGARTRSGCRRTRARTRPAAQAAIYLLQPGANTRVRSWTPTRRPQYGFLVTHNESISIADYFTVRDGRQGGLPADLPLRLSSLQRRGAVAARDVRQCRQACRRSIHILDEDEIVDGIDELGVLLYGHAQERLLVRLAALDRGDAQARALPERDRPAGDVGRARRHGLGAGEPAGRHRRGRRDGFPPLPRGADALSRPGDRRLHRLDAARRPARASSRRTSTRRDPWQFRNVLVR